MSRQPSTARHLTFQDVQTDEEATCRLRVYRYKRGDGGEHFDEFEVPVGPHTTVLDALRWIQLPPRPLAGASAFLPARLVRHLRHASRRPRAAGVRVLGPGSRTHEITVEPLANLPVLTDLVVEMNGFFARFPHEHPIIR